MTQLSVEGVSHRVGMRRILEDVSLCVEAGFVTALLGSNGAGKTTLFRLLTGLDVPQQGRVTLAGMEVTRWPLHRRVRAGLGFVPQQSSIFPRLTVLENLRVALEAVGRPPADAGAILESEGLSHVATQLAGSLSGGEKRRLELARCLALRPRWVLLDEPFAGLDPINVRFLCARLRKLADSGMGVLLADHHARDALNICDRAILIEKGVIQITGTPAELAANSWARDAYLGVDDVW